MVVAMPSEDDRMHNLMAANFAVDAFIRKWGAIDERRARELVAQVYEKCTSQGRPGLMPIVEVLYLKMLYKSSYDDSNPEPRGGK